MFNYILFTGAAYFIYYNLTNIIWIIFYYYAYIECVFKSRLCIKDTKSKKDKKMYLGILKNNKTVVEYDFSKEEDYLFYYCCDYKSCDLKTNYKFIAINLNIYHDDDKETHAIYLQNNDITFYLENNAILSKEFINWYCSVYNNFDAPKNDNYEISIIDNLANIQTIKPTQYIKLNKDFYEIKNID